MYEKSFNFQNYFNYNIVADKTPPGFPVIQLQPSTRVIEIGHTALMNCRAIGSPAPKIHWLKDMKRVDILSTSRYTLLDGMLFGTFPLSFHPISKPFKIEDVFWGFFSSTCKHSFKIPRITTKQHDSVFSFVNIKTVLS